MKTSASMLDGAHVMPLAAPKGTKMVCELCQKPAQLLCTGCRAAYYCCDDHQRTAWASVHSKVCRLVGAMAGGREFYNLEERRLRDDALRQQKLRITQTALVCSTRHIYGGRPALALPAAKQALATAAEVFGSACAELVRPLLLLASGCVLLGELDSAEGYLSQAEWTLIYARHEGHALRAQMFRGWSQLLAAREDWLQAKQCSAEDVHHSAEAFGPEDVRCTLGHFRLAEALLQLDKPEIAASLYRQVVANWEAYFYGELPPGESRRPLADTEVIESAHVLAAIRSAFSAPSGGGGGSGSRLQSRQSTASSLGGLRGRPQWWQLEANAQCVAKLDLLLNRLRSCSPGLELADSAPGSSS